MVDLTAHRVESFEYTLLDTNDKPLGPLDGVEPGGKLTYSIHNTIRSGGQIDYAGETRPWERHRIKIEYTATVGEESETWPLGVFIPVTPETTHSSLGQTQTLDLMDKLQVLQEDMFEGTVIYKKGQNVISIIKNIIQSAGENNMLLEDSGATLRANMAWEPGETKLKVINELLETINYFSLYCDGNGFYRAEKYVKPLERPVVFNFEEGENCIFADEFTKTLDRYKVPNKVVLISGSTSDELALRGVAVNKLDKAIRGRWVTFVDTGVEAVDQTTINALAEKTLREKADIAATLDIEHAALPPELNGRVTFKGHGVEMQAVIQTLDVPLAVGGLTSATIRELSLELD